jgi:hypothetical protein
MAAEACTWQARYATVGCSLGALVHIHLVGAEVLSELNIQASGAIVEVDPTREWSSCSKIWPGAVPVREEGGNDWRWPVAALWPRIVPAIVHTLGAEELHASNLEEKSAYMQGTQDVRVGGRWRVSRAARGPKRR